MKYHFNIIEYVLNLGNRSRKLLLFSCDIANLFISLLISFYLLEGSDFLKNVNQYLLLFILSVLIATPLFIFTRQYNGLTRYIGSVSFYRLIIRNIFLIILLILISHILFNYKISLIFWSNYFFLIISNSILFRIILRDILYKIKDDKTLKRKKESIVIYGSTKYCMQIVNILKKSEAYNIISIINNNPDFSERYVDNIPIHSTSFIKKVAHKIDKILIAKDELSKSNQIKLIDDLGKFGIPIFLIPPLEELIISSNKINTFKPISIEGLLARDFVPPQKELLGPGITNKVICVTGAGGSIGSELCHQLIKLSPKQIILIENNEPSLYKIDKELKKVSKNVSIVSLLLDCSNENKLKYVFENYDISVFFHAAAYKHVSIVENNPLSGIQNNVFSSFYICKLASSFNINSVVLISSDKAVRPTNVMGATKRLSELIFQVFSKDYPNIKFSIVRFGNVLDSSGSVIPLFKEQISKGGPITITHPDVIRYFMTIEEAALLVIQANLLSDSGDVSLLDMGKPVKIIDLARHLINLNGLKIRDKNNPDGDIELKIIGLRSGEKLYEELLIDPNSLPTKHPLIFKAREKSMSSSKLHDVLNEMTNLINNNKLKELLNTLKEVVPEWELSDSLKKFL